MLELLKVKKQPVTLIVFIVCAAVFITATTTDPENIRFLAFDYNALPERWYALLTYGFVHVDWNHIIINMGLLLWIGIWVERLIGSARYSLLILLGILAGGLTLLFRETAGIGFSAGAAALIFYYNFAFPMNRELVFNIPNVVLPVVILVGSVLAIIFDWLPAVGHYPHIAGGLVGIVLLLIFRKHHRSIEDP